MFGRTSYFSKKLLTERQLKRLSPRSGISGFLKSHKAIQVITAKTTSTLGLTLLDTPNDKTLTALDSLPNSTTPDVPISLDMPAPGLLAMPAPETTIPSEHPPTNPHDPGPPVAIGSLCFIACRPSDPHDPGPSTAFAYFIVTALTYLGFPAITNYALIDFLRIPPRSPSIVYIVL